VPNVFGCGSIKIAPILKPSRRRFEVLTRRRASARLFDLANPRVGDPMKRSKFLSISFLILAMTGVALAQGKPANRTGPAPRLAIDATTHDFGEVKTGESLRWAFKIKNTGDADLVIQNVAPS
jgi:hypothetical protein